MTSIGHPDEKKTRCIDRAKSGEDHFIIAQEERVGQSTIRRWVNEGKKLAAHKSGLTELRQKHAPIKPTLDKPDCVKSIIPPLSTNPRILIYDIETLPNLGYFFDTYSDRAIPLEFILKPKSICTIAWKWYGDDKTNVAVMDAPYDDKTPLNQFMPDWTQATHVVAHYSKFDKPFIAARLMANGLHSLPPVNDICTYKLAKSHFGRSLNGNKLDHLGTILGVGRKNKTNADLWVKCAAGDKEALAEMAAYNAQDVELLEKVFKAMLPHVKSKLNLNLMSDEPILRCKQCGSDHLEQKGFEYTSAAMRHRYHCKVCDSWSTFTKGQIC